MAFLNILSDTLGACSSDDFMFLGGDFNCKENPTLDRNHPEPHPTESDNSLRHTSCLMCGGFLTKITGSTPGATQEEMFYLWPDCTVFIVLIIF